MEANGKQISNLFWKGTKFTEDKSGKSVQFKRTVKVNNIIAADGSISHDLNYDINIGSGTLGFVILTTYKNSVYTGNNDAFKVICGWVSKDDIQILD